MRLHECRHSFALRALPLGESLPIIGRLLGHSQVQTTTRYAHLARDSVHEAARRVSDRIEAALYRDCPGFAGAKWAAVLSAERDIGGSQFRVVADSDCVDRRWNTTAKSM